MTIQQALSRAQSHLAATSDAPHLDAAWLLLSVMQQNETAWLLAHGNTQLSPVQERLLEYLVQQRRVGRPLAYILGWAEFYGRRFLVDERVLIPRSSTEALIDAALEYIEHSIVRNMEETRRLLTIADIGTGSGCIAITLALEAREKLEIGNQKLVIVATDISPDALDVAGHNAVMHGVADQIEFLEGNMLEPLAGRHIDLIVSNPPYVPTPELQQVRRFPTPETAGLAFEPQSALNGGTDGQRYTGLLIRSAVARIVESTGGRILKYLVR